MQTSTKRRYGRRPIRSQSEVVALCVCHSCVAVSAVPAMCVWWSGQWHDPTAPVGSAWEGGGGSGPAGSRCQRERNNRECFESMPIDNWPAHVLPTLLFPPPLPLTRTPPPRLPTRVCVLQMEGASALFIGAHTGSVPLVTLLLDRGADKDLTVVRE